MKCHIFTKLVFGLFLLSLLVACENKKAVEPEKEKNIADIISLQKAFEGRCQLYQASADGNISVTSRNCRTIVEPAKLQGYAGYFVNSSGKEIFADFVNVTQRNNVLVFKGHRSAKLAGLYMKLELSRKRMISLGFKKNSLEIPNIIYPYRTEQGQFPVKFVANLKSIGLHQMSDDFKPDIALAPGVAAMAYFSWQTQQKFPSVLEKSDKFNESNIIANSKNAIILGWAIAFGISESNSKIFMEKLKLENLPTLKTVAKLDNEDFRKLALKKYSEADSLKIATNFANCLMLHRPTKRAEALEYDKKVFSVFGMTDNPLKNYNFTIANSMEHFASNADVIIKKAFCQCSAERLAPVFTLIAACKN